MATSYLSPGVYVEEVDRGTKPIEAVGTSTVGFLGTCNKGPVNKPVFITNWSQFVNTFGDFRDSDYLAHAVYGFFNNGGSRCFVCNVGSTGTAPALTAKDEKGGAAPPKPAIDQKKLAAMFIGEDKGPGKRTGLKAFDDVDDINIVCAPGVTDPAVVDAILTHCEVRKDRFAILDSPEVIEEGGVDKLPKPRDSKYGAYYFPWIEVYDPERGNIFVPPSGHMAGIYARTDAERGVHKAPANEIVRGALGLRYSISRGEQDILNPKGINCIRDFSRRGRGIRVWGCAHALERRLLALHQRAAAVHHDRAVHRAGHAVGGVRAERPHPVEEDHPRHPGVSVPHLADGGAVRQDAGGGLLRQVR
ncbi:MAG: hypothetical protein KatS3mg102_2083 [Planctomycetota bacterium]|nr:MAG: hypothetical protein KatS3mg102_2083 [Planctomycetota bacterium]